MQYALQPDHVQSTCCILCIKHLLHLSVRDTYEKQREHTYRYTHDQSRNAVENNQLSHRNRTDINQSLVAASADFTNTTWIAAVQSSLSHSTHSYICTGVFFPFLSHSFTNTHMYDIYETQISIFGRRKKNEYHFSLTSNTHTSPNQPTKRPNINTM